MSTPSPATATRAASVAVITRTKNRALLLRRALESVTSQTLTDWHHVVVNDGGDPKLVNQVLAGYRQTYGDRLTVLHNPESVGMEAASNLGIRAVDSRYVVIHDDDDSWDPAFLEKTVARLEAADKRTAGVVSRTWLVTERIEGETVIEEKRERWLPGMPNVTLASVVTLNRFPPISFLYRRAVFEAIGFYDESLPVLGDWEFNVRFLSRFNIDLLDEPLANWHIRYQGGSYGNTVTAGQQRHDAVTAVLRNNFARDAAIGPGTLSAFAEVARAALQDDERLGRILSISNEWSTHFTSLQQAHSQLSGSLHEAIGLLETERAAHDEERRYLQRLLEAERGRAAALEGEIRGLRASTSWRMTAPLRWSKTLFTGGHPRPNRLLPRRHILAAGEGTDMVREEDHFRCTGPSGQLVLTSSVGRAPVGWALVECEVDDVNGRRAVPRLVTFDPAGSANGHFDVVGRPGKPQLLRLPNTVGRLELYPMVGTGAFTVKRLVIRELTLAQVAFRIGRPYLARAAIHPGTTLARTAKVIRMEGVSGLRQRLLRSAQPAHHYDEWISRFESLRESDRAAMAVRMQSFRTRPTISVVMPIYNTPERFLRRAIESVQGQIYPHWELCIADDNSPDETAARVVQEYAERDPRVKFMRRQQNGHISAASNSALELVSGEYIALLDHDDELHEQALYWVAEEIEAHPEAELIYTDEDKIDEEGKRHNPYFKCDWNPDLMCSHNLITHLGVYRTATVRAVGGFRSAFDGAQDYDLALRVIDSTRPENIRHIPRVLYHWRAIAGSTALSHEEKPYAHNRARQAIADHLKRRGYHDVQVMEAFSESVHRVIYPLPKPAPKVTVIIPTKDRADLLDTCITGLLQKTEYPGELDILVVNNRSEEQATFDLLDRLKQTPGIRVEDWDHPYNYAAMNNWAAARTDAPLLAFLNNDIEVIETGWLSEMVRHALRPEVGAVGARLLYPDNTLQHAGVIVGLGGLAGHAHTGMPRTTLGYAGRAALIQNFSAVTAACMVMRRKVFEAVGGFDAETFGIAYNDVDLCLRIGKTGLRCVWTPYAELYHHESVSLGPPNSPKRREQFQREARAFVARWDHVIRNDPAYNPNLTLDDGSFGLSFRPRVRRPWEPEISL